MVAGIAREINNPINFIHGNVQHMNGYIQDLLKLIQLYQQTYPDRTREIHEMSNSLDLPFIATDLPKMMNSMKSGSERIHNMVLSLQNFSRLDESEKNPTALHKSLDNTLVLLGFFTTKARSEDTGLDLAICHKVMQKHSGSITVQSVLGQGSTCRLQFPIQLAVS